MFSKQTFSDIQCMLDSNALCICNIPEQEISCVQDYCAGEPTLDDCLYICTPENYKAAEAGSIRNAIICAEDKPKSKKIKTTGNLIVVSSQAELYMVTTKVLARLSEFARIGSSSLMLQNLSIGKTPLENILAYAHKELGNPIVLTDASFLIVSKLGLDNVSEPDWAFAEKNGSFPPSFIGKFMNDDEFFDADDEYVKLIGDDKKRKHETRQMISKLSFADKTIGFFLVLENDKPFSEYDKTLASMVGSFLSQVIGHNDHKLLLNTSFHEDFLTSILSEAITSPDEILLKQETFGIKLDKTLRLIAIDMPLAIMDSDTTQKFIRELRVFFNKNSIVVPYENAIVILMDTPNDTTFMSESEFKGLENLLNAYGCKANVSAPFHYLYQTRRHYMQVMMCSTLRSMLHIDKPILGYHKEMAEYHMIFNYSMVQNLDNLLHPAVIKLRSMDEEHGTDMLTTLFAYTDHLCNLTATSKALYLHYNTLKYRIDKITSITDIDFTNSDDVHRIVLSKRVLQIEEAIGNIE